jgi:hypothetical protein
MSEDLFALMNLPAMTPAERRKLIRKGPTPSGYAAPPGTGPQGETCQSCRHRAVVAYAKNYQKCELNRARWTGGKKTDILVRSPACRLWERAE